MAHVKGEIASHATAQAAPHTVGAHSAYTRIEELAQVHPARQGKRGLAEAAADMLHSAPATAASRVRSDQS